MNVKVEQNVPLPPRNRCRVWPWDTMAVGDSIFCTGSRFEGSAVGALSAAKRYTSRHPQVKFESRKIDRGIRIWRVR